LMMCGAAQHGGGRKRRRLLGQGTGEAAHRPPDKRRKLGVKDEVNKLRGVKGKETMEDCSKGGYPVDWHGAWLGDLGTDTFWKRGRRSRNALAGVQMAWGRNYITGKKRSAQLNDPLI